MSRSYTGPILDAHVHQWDPRTSPRTVSPVVKALGWSRPLLMGLAQRAFPAAQREFVGAVELPLTPYLPGDWFRDSGGRAVGFVHIQADYQGDPVGETAWLEHTVGRDLRALVGAADLASADLADVLDRHAATSGRFVGIRDYLAHGGENEALASFAPAPDRFDDPAWRRGFELLGARGLTFDAWAYGPQLAGVARLVADVPGTRVVLDHCGSPVGYGGPYAGEGMTAPERAGILDRWRDDLATIAANPQVNVKLSGQGLTVAGHAWHRRATPPGVDEVIDAWAPVIGHALEVFGPQRSIIASNFPMDSVSVRWETAIEALDQLTSHLTDEQRRGLFCGNAAAFYGIDLGDAAGPPVV